MNMRKSAQTQCNIFILYEIYKSIDMHKMMLLI